MKDFKSYEGKPVDSRQGQKFEAFNRLGGDIIKVLDFLVGHPWDDYALGFIHSLRPSTIRVVGPNEGVQLSALKWRVTVYLNSDRQITCIEQEVEVGLPEGIDNGYTLATLLSNREIHPFRNIALRGGQLLSKGESADALNGAMEIIEKVGTTGIEHCHRAAEKWMKAYYPSFV